MTLFELTAMLLTVAAICGFLNEKFIKLPTTIGLMLIASVFSIILLGAEAMGSDLAVAAERIIEQVDFEETLMEGMLCFLLFAGALHMNLENLLSKVRIIGIMASVGVVLSTCLVGVLTKGVIGMMGVELPWIYCFLFGALISPTDPIAVVALLKKVGAPKSLETKIVGESLFNDGVGVVVFLVLYKVLTGAEPMTAGFVAKLFLMEAVGGVMLGLVLGYLGYRMLKVMDNYSIEILVTLALVMGGYALAMKLHVSGPLAMVVIGLMMGNIGRVMAMSEKTREHLDTFWELVDEILNAMLFVLIGLELVILEITPSAIGFGLLAIPLVLFIRFVCVGFPITLFRKLGESFTPHAIKALTWGGLRGGISVALALSLPAGPERNLLLVATYCVVLFSIIVQGLTMERLLEKVKSSMSS